MVQVWPDRIGLGVRRRRSGLVRVRDRVAFRHGCDIEHDDRHRHGDRSGGRHDDRHHDGHDHDYGDGHVARRRQAAGDDWR